MNRGERERLPVRRRSTRYKFRLGETGVYLDVGVYPDERIGEIFINIAKSGVATQAVFSLWAMSLSKALQYGTPLHILMDSYTKTDFKVDPNGFLFCEDLPNIHRKKFKNLWECVARILVEITEPDGRLKP